jgi:hypothetical protein
MLKRPSRPKPGTLNGKMAWRTFFTVPSWWVLESNIHSVDANSLPKIEKAMTACEDTRKLFVRIHNLQAIKGR